MGTRNITMVFHEGSYKVAQYGQWDGDPGGQGLTALLFLLQEGAREKLIAGLSRLAVPTEADIEKINETPNWAQTYPSLSRDTGAEILALIAESQGPLFISLDLKFPGDSLFCEWGYVIDLDKSTFEIYEGFNQDHPLGEGDRFVNLTKRDSYYPIRLIKSYDLVTLPTKDEFLKEFELKEEEEEE